jgi:hypothetical protein
VTFGCRGARLARRDDREYLDYLRGDLTELAANPLDNVQKKEQRSQPGWIGGRTSS